MLNRSQLIATLTLCGWLPARYFMCYYGAVNSTGKLLFPDDGYLNQAAFIYGLRPELLPNWDRHNVGTIQSIYDLSLRGEYGSA